MASSPTEATDVRARGRELVLSVLCSADGHGDEQQAQPLTEMSERLLGDPPVGDAEGEEAFAELASDPDVRSWAAAMLGIMAERTEEIDALIRATSAKWRLERMDRVDRNVIRLAAAELMARASTPTAVVLSEAVRLAGRYGSDRSTAFVNGVAQSLAERVRS